MKLPLVLFMFLFLTGCPDKEEDPDYILEINNRSEIDLLFTFDKLFPDTTLWSESPFSNLNCDQLLIVAGETGTIDFYDEEFSEMTSNERIRLFLFKKEVINSISWDTIVKYYMIEKRFDLTLLDLERMDWTIVYEIE